MKEKIISIIEPLVETYGFVSKTEYLEKRRLLNIDDAFNNVEFLKPYKTIITLGIAYPSEEVKWLGKGYGVLSRYSYNIDYHIVFKVILDKITEELRKLSILAYASVDTGFIDERYAAYLSGIGFLGKNQFLINKTYGSYLYLATILIDKEISKNDFDYDSCKDCRLCIDACPSNALDHGFDSSKCISSLTQMKQPFNAKEVSHIKTMIYGCDICQKVCPKNKDIDFHIHKQFEPSGIENINIKEILSMTNKEYKKLYGKNASSWKGATIIKRNALCLIANQRLVEHIPLVKSVKEKHKETSWFNDTANTVIELLHKDCK